MIRRIVIKLGTQTLINPNGGVESQVFQDLAKAVENLKSNGLEVVVVSSGAVGLGRNALSLQPPLTTAEKQACAAIGQGRLMHLYEELFSQHHTKVAQVLVTARDFSDRHGFLSLRDTFETLLKFGVVPIVNENDSVSTAELKETELLSFGDNDKLSSIVASKLGADLLVLLTNVDGIYERNPQRDSSAQRLRVVRDLKTLETINTHGTSEMGRGGMATKIEAARLAAICGVATVVGSAGILAKIGQVKRDSAFDELADLGTLILPHTKLKGRKKWIGVSSGYRGTLHINEGASRAVVERNASLLIVGVESVEGDFDAGDVVSLRDKDGAELGRGVARLSSAELLVVLEEKSKEYKSSPICIHRDELALFLQEGADVGST